MDGEGEGRSEGLRGEEEVENTVGMQYMRIMNKKKRFSLTITFRKDNRFQDISFTMQTN